MSLASSINWVLAISLCALLLLEAAVPRTAPLPSSAEKIRHTICNFTLWIFGSLSIWVVSSAILRHTSGWHSQATSVIQYLPWYGQLLLGVLIVDFGEYLRHWLFHRARPLWLVHAVHHSDCAVDVTTGFRFHPLEFVIINSVHLGLLIGCGLPVYTLVVRAAVQLPVSSLQHAAIRLPRRLEAVAEWLIVTPSMHRVHHSVLEREADSNYGEVFSIWDRLFGTYLAPERAFDGPMGLVALSAAPWHTVPGLLATPLRARHIYQF